jgi:hypothetical protein
LVVQKLGMWQQQRHLPSAAIQRLQLELDKVHKRQLTFLVVEVTNQTLQHRHNRPASIARPQFSTYLKQGSFSQAQT